MEAVSDGTGRWFDPLDQYKGQHAAFSDAQVLQAKKVFHLYGGKDISKMLRGVGLLPSFLDLRQIAAKDKVYTFQEFLDVYSQFVKERDTVDQLMALLKSFDHDNDGTIDSDELTSALTTIGDKMTPEEVKKLIDAVGANSRGRIQIAVLAHYLLAQ